MSKKVFAPVALVAALAVLIACATNPATGKKQISLIGESQEIAMGREADQQLVQQLGLYGDDDLQRYVDQLGQSLAAKSERPDLPWTFRVVDDPVVNAFALPGGFIYVTRGIMTHLESEAELAGVLGHEIGHVTARHSVNQLSKAQLAQIGLVAGMIAAPEMGQAFGNLAQTGLGLMFLKFGRDDERQADELGVRYMSRGGYPPPALAGVFEMLGRASQAAGGDRLPGWLSTHPDPGNRRELIAERSAGLPAEVLQAPEREGPYLTRVDGMIFGPNPREGFFRGSTFHHPELAFRMRFPDGWETRNLKQAVVAQSPNNDALIVLTLTDQSDPRRAAEEFYRQYQQQGVESGGAWVRNQNSLSSVSDNFRVVNQQGQVQLRGGVAFTEHQGRVYRLLGYTKPERWSSYDDDVARAVASFGPERDRDVLNVKPQRIDIVRLDRDMTLEEFKRRYKSDVSIEKLALLNRVDPGDTLRSGTRVKRVVGDDPSS